MTDIFDVIIVGGGPAGVLAAARIHQQNDALSILIVEKDPWLGGRLRSSAREAKRWSYGLNTISQSLFELWNQILKADPEARDLPSFMGERQHSFGVLAASKITTIAMRDMFGKGGAKAVAGGAAVRDWPLIDKLCEDVAGGKKGEQAFSQAFGGNRKSPSGLVLEHFASIWGVPDLWTAATSTLLGRATLQNEGFYTGRWEEALDEVLASPSLKEKLTIKTKCLVVNASQDEGMWRLATEQGAMTGRSLVVSQSPWDAILWLPKDFWPSPLLTLTLKSKPVSVVVLSDAIVAPSADLPDVLLIPAENVQALRNGPGELCFQATLDYELTLQAPAVVKAVKRLRRAKQKVLNACPDLKTEGDHIALLPVGWAHPSTPGDRRTLERLDKQDFHSPTLAFCGDAYGSSADADRNFASSLIAACDTVAG